MKTLLLMFFLAVSAGSAQVVLQNGVQVGGSASSGLPLTGGTMTGAILYSNGSVANASWASISQGLGCTSANPYWSFYANTCVAAMQPGGSTGQFQYRGSSGTFLGGPLSTDGTNLTASGNVATGTTLSPNPATGAYTPGSVVSALIPQYAYALPHLQTVEGLMLLNRAGYSGYTTPAQLYAAFIGDSTASAHSWEKVCSFLSAIGPVGYIGQVSTGSATSFGQYCPSAGTGPGTIALSGGATAVPSTSPDYVHLPLYGTGYSLPPGGVVTTGNPVYSTREMALLNATNATSFEVDYSTNGTTWTALPNGTGIHGETSLCNGTSVPGTETVCDAVIGYAQYYLRVKNNDATNTIYLSFFGQVDTTHNGVVPIGLGRGGLGIGDAARGTDPTVMSQFIGAMAPDFVAEEWKNDPPSGYVGGVCQSAPSSNPTSYLPWSTDHATVLGFFTTAVPLVSIEEFLSYPAGTTLDPNACMEQHNQVQIQYAQSNPMNARAVDNYSQLTHAQQFSEGWIDSSVHETALGQLAMGTMDSNYDAIDLGMIAAAGNMRNVVGNKVIANETWVGSESTTLTGATPQRGLCTTTGTAAVPGCASAHTYSDASANTSVDTAGNWSIYNVTHTTPELSVVQSGSAPSGAQAYFKSGQLNLYPSGTTILSNCSGTNCNGQFSVNGTVRANINARSNQSTYDVYGATGTKLWGMGVVDIGTGTDFLLYDAVGSKNIFDIPSNTVPASSLGGNASGLTVPTLGCGTTTNIVNEAYVSICVGVTTTVSWTPAAVTASTCAVQTVAVSGIVTGKVVSVNPPADLSHVWIGSARASSAGNVSVQFCADATGGTPASGNWLFKQ